MAIIIDKRNNKDSIGNVKRKFFNRHRIIIQEQIDNIIRTTKIKNLQKKSKTDIIIPGKSLAEPVFRYDYSKHEHRNIITGNKTFSVGDIYTMHKSGQGDGDPSGAGRGTGAEDDFIFTLTKEEFFYLLFENLELPNFIRKSGDIKKYLLKRAGYTKTGVYSKLDLKKTCETAIARRIASNFTDETFLDDIDLRYRFFKKKPIPWANAVMFCVMDVSGSMGIKDKLIAKKFYLLLYLFLEQKYQNVDIVFIRYHTEAKECDERLFFYDTETGGTEISPALELVKKKINEKYTPDKWNIYLSLTSDGDNWGQDNAKCKRLLTENLLPIISYFTYYKVRKCSDTRFDDLIQTLIKTYSNIYSRTYSKGVFKDFSEFFKKRL